MAASGIIIHFGKHKGKDLEDVPASYLLWLYKEVKQLDFHIRAYIEKNMNGIKKQIEDGNRGLMGNQEDKTRDYDLKKTVDAFARGVSPCCNAPIDSSRVITSGRHRGHGPRICSKCKKLLFFV